jgi:hypothetical protein
MIKKKKKSLMEECYMCMYTLICNFIVKFQLKGLKFFIKRIIL